MDNETTRTESREEVESFLAKLRYAIGHGAKLFFQIDRKSEANRPIEYTNRYTVADLFPNDSPEEALKRELLTLTVSDYISTNKDLLVPKKSELRVFGKTYEGAKNVYIKIRVEILAEQHVFVLSFHYALFPFQQKDFPYHQ